MYEPPFSSDRHRRTLESARQLIRMSREMRLSVASLVDESRSMIEGSQHEFDKRRAVAEQQAAAVETFYEQDRDSHD